MLTALRLGNFKAFADTQSIPIRPITLIFGPNSAGKSSIIHGLVLAHEAERTGRLDVYKTELGGSSIDLGGFRQYVHRTEARRRMEFGAELNVSKFTGRLSELLATARTVRIGLTVGVELDNEDRPIPGAEPAVWSYELLADNALLLRMSRRRDGKLRLDRLDQEHAVLREVLKAIVTTATTTDAITPSDYEGISEAIASLVPDINAPTSRLLPEGLSIRITTSDVGQTQLFPVSRGNRTEDLANAIQFFLPRTLNELIKGTSQAVTAELKKLQLFRELAGAFLSRSSKSTGCATVARDPSVRCWILAILKQSFSGR